jgi:hypothetical protein
MAFDELALVQSVKAGSETSVNDPGSMTTEI